MNLNDQVISFIQDLDYQDLPPEVKHQAGRCFLDLSGALLAGMETPVARLMTEFAVENFSGREAAILVSGRRASPAGAVLANGFAANALDIDDGYRLVKGHPGACVIPVALTAAEIAGRTGRELLTAVVAGYEVGIRAGLIRHAVSQTYHSSGSWGAVAGAAAAGRLLGLDSGALRQALGTAEYHAPIAPMMKAIDRPCMAKDSIGWGCLAAMSAALLARSGFTGVEPMFADTLEDQWIEELGRKYRMLDLYFKPYAACRWAQPAVAGALKVVEENDLKPEEMKSILVYTFTEAAALACAPPGDTEEAQYNLAFPVAAALLDGRVGPDQVLPPRLFDRELLDLAGRISVKIKPEYDRAFPEQTLAEVVVITDDNQKISSGTALPMWEPPEFPSNRELEDKFLWLVEPVLGQDQARRLAALILGLDELESLEPLFELAQK